MKFPGAKIICAVLFVAILFSVAACTEGKDVFTKTEDGTVISPSGTEYAHLAYEGILYYLGELEFQGRIAGEPKTFQHLGGTFQTGMFSIKEAETDNILVRSEPNNEWFSIYRKASLPPFDYSVDNCIRIELVSGSGYAKDDGMHTTCGDGIVDSTVISQFLSEVRAQPDPREAGLYDSVKRPDGMLENCYMYAVVYGFFEEEPNLAVYMDITSFNDLGYSISIEGEEYVLPEIWLEKLQSSSQVKE